MVVSHLMVMCVALNLRSKLHALVRAMILISSRYLAALHGLDFVTPSLVALAVKKVFPHRITIASPERERSMQFGSDITAVKHYLEGLTPELAIESVLAKVDCPL
jgi:hypothetical protein